MVSVGVPVRVAVILSGNSVDNKVAAIIVVKTADDVEQSGFSASRWAKYCYQLVFTEAQIYTTKCCYLGVPRGLGFYDLFELKHFCSPFEILC